MGNVNFPGRRPDPEKNILFAGRGGAGKSFALYRCMGINTFSYVPPQPTLGFNNELVYFRDQHRCYEFWDPTGSRHHRSFWKSFYQHIHIHIIVYVIDVQKYVAGDKTERERALVKDRMELHTLLFEEDLRFARFVIFLNWKVDGKSVVRDMEQREDLLDHMFDVLQLQNIKSDRYTMVDALPELVAQFHA